MKLFAGVSVTDYQDVLRAIGALIDEQGLRDIRLWEHEHGMVVQGRRPDAEADGFETFLLTDDDITAVMRDAYSRRGLPGTRLGEAAVLS